MSNLHEGNEIGKISYDSLLGGKIHFKRHVKKYSIADDIVSFPPA